MKDDAIRRRHFQDSLLPRGLPAKELANRLLVRVPPRVRKRARARAHTRLCRCVCARAAGKYSCVLRSISSKMATKNPTNTIAATSNPLLRLGEWAQKRGDVTTGMIVMRKIAGNMAMICDLTSFFPRFFLKLCFVLFLQK